jgi:hypothetical protein
MVIKFEAGSPNCGKVVVNVIGGNVFKVFSGTIVPLQRYFGPMQEWFLVIFCPYVS